MTLDKLLVVIGGVGLVGFVAWFFFGKKPSSAEIMGGQGIIDIVVEGGYKPENIKIKKGKTTKLVFERRDPNSCLEEIIIPDFKIKKYLPLNEKVEISLTPNKAGIYPTHCGMGMFHGKIIVE